MLNLRIKQAEVAMADGRLEEAMEIARDQEVRGHRRGQQLITDLVDRFVERARQHFDDDRLDNAQADCERAKSLGGRQPKIAQLEVETRERIAERRARSIRRRATVETAMKSIESGEYSIGARICDEIEDGSTSSGLRQEVVARRASYEKALHRAKGAFEREDIDQAIADLISARSLKTHSEEVIRLARELQSSAAEKIRNNLEEGRIDLARNWITRIDQLQQTSSVLDELRAVLSQCGVAAKCLERSDFSELGRALGVLQKMLPNATWIKESYEHANAANAAMSRLREGPLPLATREPGVATEHVQIMPPARLAVPTSDVLPSRFYLHVDGAGVMLVIAEPKISIGSSRSGAVDLPLMVSSVIPRIVIERSEDDYFLHAKERVSINDRKVNTKLLANNDRLRLAASCSFRFLMPCAASSTAVLDLDGTRTNRPDIKRVILFDDAITIAPHNAAHVQARPIKEPFVLFRRHERMYANVAGNKSQPRTEIPMEKNVCLGGINVVIKPA